jgi:hypothetical protein
MCRRLATAATGTATNAMHSAPPPGRNTRSLSGTYLLLIASHWQRHVTGREDIHVGHAGQVLQEGGGPADVSPALCR